MTHSSNTNNSGKFNDQPHFSYTKEMVQLLKGDHISALILCKAIYWAKSSSNRFFKFQSECKHPFYKKGDSWCEELMLNKYVFRKHLKQLKEYIIVRKGCNNIFYYSVNFSLLIPRLIQVRKNNQENQMNMKNQESKLISMFKSEILEFENKQSDHQMMNSAMINLNSHMCDSETSFIADNIQDNKSRRTNEDFEEKIELLAHYNIKNADAETIAKKFSLDYIKKSLKNLEKRYEKGEIKSIRAYAITMFKNSSEECSEFEKNQLIKQQNKAIKKKQEEEELKKKKELEMKQKDEKERIFQQLLLEANDKDLNDFLIHLRDHQVIVYHKYLRYGIENLYVEAHYKQFLYDRKVQGFSKNQRN